MSSSYNPQSHPQPGMRKPYSKPQVIQVRLVPEEAVLITGCKTTTTISGQTEGSIGCMNRGCFNIDGT